MSDRLTEIEERWTIDERDYLSLQLAQLFAETDIDWLIAEVKRLRAELQEAMTALSALTHHVEDECVYADMDSHLDFAHGVLAKHT